MTASKKIERYSSEWLATCDWLCENPTETLVMKCASNKDARAMRLEFYKAREAIQASEIEMKNTDYKTYAQMGHGALDAREACVSSGSDEVHFIYKDTNKMSMVLKAGLEEANLKLKLKKENGTDV